ncbi:MAG: AraC family transcriptional regulator [Sphaerochaetaceae bacterium]
METNIDTMRRLLLAYLPSARGGMETGVDGVSLFRVDASFKKRPQLYQPQIILLAQGKKRIYLGDNQFEYDSCHYYVQAVPLPVECEAVIEEGKPMLGMVLKIDPQMIGEILYEMNPELPVTGKVSNSLYDAVLSDEIVDAAVRLLKTLHSQNEKRVLGPLYLKELIFKVLCGEKGEILRELAINNRGFYQISRIINKIHENYSDPFDVQMLAREAGMSSTAFHSTFRAMTSTSPLQYIKNVRLHKAKELIQQGGEKASAAALLVGYESSSQFSREYKRCFGVTPGADRLVV